MNVCRPGSQLTRFVFSVVTLLALAGCGAGQPQVIRETVVVVATATPEPAAGLADAQTVTVEPETTPIAALTVTAAPTIAQTPAPATTLLTPQPLPTATELMPSPSNTPAPAAPPSAATQPPAANPAQPANETAPQLQTPPTQTPTMEPTALPVNWLVLPVLTSSALAPATQGLEGRSFSPVTFSGPTQPVKVVFRIVDPTGKVVGENEDDDSPWCPVDDATAGCATLRIRNNQWPSGDPVIAGQYTLLMVAIDAANRESQKQAPFALDFAWGDLPVLGTTAIVPQGGGNVPVILHVSPVVFTGARPMRVAFSVLDPNGDVVFERVDGDSPWCAFGDADEVANCMPLRFESPAWPSGRPLVTGRHTLSIRAEDAQDGTQNQRVVFTVDMLPREISTPVPQQPSKPDLPRLTVVVAATQVAAPLESPAQIKRMRVNGDLDMQLIYPATARDSLVIFLNAKRPGAVENGEGVGRVEFLIIDANGNVVNREEESTPAFCAFGGSDPCNAIALKQGAVWPSTDIPISTGPYVVQVTVWGKDDNGNQTGPWRGRAAFDVIVPGQN